MEPTLTPAAGASDCRPDPDHELLRDVLLHLPGAWPRFLARFGRLTRDVIDDTARRGPVPVAEADLPDIHAAFLASLFFDDHKKLRAFTPDRGCDVASWLVFLARRATCDFVRASRAERRARQAARMVDAALALHAGAVVPAPDQLVDEKRHAIRVRDAAASGLTPRQRELFALCFEEQMEPAHVARLLGLSVQTVHSARHKIAAFLLRTLRSCPTEAPRPVAA